MRLNHIFSKNKLSLITVFAALLFLSSCRQVIDIELKDAERKYVIEGAVYEGVDSAMVRVTKTTSFFDTTPPEAVSDAVVTLTMPDNSLVNMNYVGQGYYKATGLNVVTSATYSLRVQVGQNDFTASSDMQESVPIDSLESEFQPGIFGSDDGYGVFYNYQDQFGDNFYRFIYSQNGKPLNEPQDIQVVDDNLNDGNYIRIPIFSRIFDPGDTIYAELQSIDADLYNFYQTYAAAASADAGSPFAAAPANPETNIKGGALGVFGAYTRSFGTIIMPE